MSDTRKLLAMEDGFGRVYECDCGVIHIAVGFADLAFSRDGFLRLQSLVRAAGERLQPPTRSAAARPFLISERANAFRQRARKVPAGHDGLP